MQPRLLTISQTAKKLGYKSTGGFNHARQTLEQREGFPKPIIAAGNGLRQKWDERAIDAWLDARMPSHLRNNITVIDGASAQREVERTLSERAAAIGQRELTHA